MEKGYLAISYSNRKYFDEVVEALKVVFASKNKELLVFVDKYDFNKNQEREMMQTAFDEIDSSDILIAELSSKSIGVGIEIGYAYAKEKEIFYLRKKGADYSTTAAGCSNEIIEYINEEDLVEQIEELLF